MNALLPMLPLAQGDVKSLTDKLMEATPQLAILFSCLVGGVMVGCVIVYIVRKRSLAANTTADGQPVTLSEVRRMHRDGEIDDDEMQRLKKIVTDRLRPDAEAIPIEEAPETAETTEEEEKEEEEEAEPPTEKEA